MVGPVLAFAGLWGVPFLTTHYGFSAAESAVVTSTLMVSWAIGGPILGAASDRIGLRKPFYLSGNLVATAGWFFLLYIPNHPLWLLLSLAAFTGFASGGMIIGFAFAKESVPIHVAGTVSGICNMGVMIGPMLLQPAMGSLLDIYWGGLMQNGVRIYSIAAYRWAFSLMLAWAVLSCIFIALTSETGCRQLIDKIEKNDG
jgi:MFS family permease